MRNSVLQYQHGVSAWRNPIKWGFEANEETFDHGIARYKLFKLQLYNKLQDTALSGQPLAPQVSESDCRKLVTDYLKALKASFELQVQALYPESFIHGNLESECIVTVPAIWSPNHKNITRMCAIDAKLGSATTIRIIKEPEAAGLYALHTMRDSNLRERDTFVICDAGGG
jgi:hypothetical protein